MAFVKLMKLFVENELTDTVCGKFPVYGFFKLRGVETMYFRYFTGGKISTRDKVLYEGDERMIRVVLTGCLCVDWKELE